MALATRRSPWRTTTSPREMVRPRLVMRATASTSPSCTAPRKLIFISTVLMVSPSLHQAVEGEGHGLIGQGGDHAALQQADGVGQFRLEGQDEAGVALAQLGHLDTDEFDEGVGGQTGPDGGFQLRGQGFDVMVHVHSPLITLLSAG